MREFLALVRMVASNGFIRELCEIVNNFKLD